MKATIKCISVKAECFRTEFGACALHSSCRLVRLGVGKSPLRTVPPRPSQATRTTTRSTMHRRANFLKLVLASG